MKREPFLRLKIQDSLKSAPKDKYIISRESLGCNIYVIQGRFYVYEYQSERTSNQDT